MPQIDRVHRRPGPACELQENDCYRRRPAGVWAMSGPRHERVAPAWAGRSALLQALQETGATGLEPATSGVTGLLREDDEWRRWPRYRSIHAVCGPLACESCTIEQTRFRAFAALLLPGNRQTLDVRVRRRLASPALVARVQPSSVVRPTRNRGGGGASRLRGRRRFLR